MAQKKAKSGIDIQSVMLFSLLIIFLGLGVFVLFDYIVKGDSTSTTTQKVENFDYANQPRIGKTTAPIKIMEFGDFKCPTCKFFHDEVYPQLKKEYIDTGKVQMYFKNLQFLGKDSVTAGMVGESIYKLNNDAFWKYYDAIYQNQQDESKEWATPAFLLDLVKKHIPEVDVKRIEAELTAKTYEKAVVTESAEAQQKYKLTAVPSIYVNGKQLDNEVALSYPKLKAYLEKELQAK
ncbi:Protein-disulfide isomerase [Seinonella peptonophila]|uniref:Protein-disulfide isomerase n=1 Tax=Seinonella peptonophila TaxID=112248 RepID=A0A1M4U6R8_9BACL|nr:thioredoxin domain-containing protein [Seinonella peptonophila]SHE52267.1 Protein-disulfide isomerase [Seinonella peptonophila]